MKRYRPDPAIREAVAALLAAQARADASVAALLAKAVEAAR